MSEPRLHDDHSVTLTNKEYLRLKSRDETLEKMASISTGSLYGYDEASFKEVTDKVIEWMCNNCHPHTTIIIDSTHAELLEGQLVHHTHQFLRD